MQDNKAIAVVTILFSIILVIIGIMTNRLDNIAERMSVIETQYNYDARIDRLEQKVFKGGK